MIHELIEFRVQHHNFCTRCSRIVFARLSHRTGNCNARRSLVMLACTDCEVCGNPPNLNQHPSSLGQRDAIDTDTASSREPEQLLR